MNRKLIVALYIPCVFTLISCGSLEPSDSSDGPVIEDVIEDQVADTSEEVNEVSDDDESEYDSYEAMTKRTYENNERTYVDDYYVYDNDGNCEYEIEIYGGFNKGNIIYSLSHYTYNEEGLPIIIQFDEYYHYDKEYQKTAKDSYSSDYWFFVYDNNGNLIYEGLPGEHHTDYFYNSANQRVRQISYSTPYGYRGEVLRSSTEFDYNSDGTKAKEVTTDKDGQTTTCSYEYNSDGLVTRYGSIYYTYDDAGLVISSNNTYDKTSTEYTYVTSPSETRQYLDLVSSIFDISSYKTKSKELMSEYDVLLENIDTMGSYVVDNTQVESSGIDADSGQQDSDVVQVNDEQYFTQGCRLVNKDGVYYILPMYSGEAIVQVKTFQDIDFPNEGIKIASNAIVGVATSVEFVETIYGTEYPTFEYEYLNFYDVVDDLIASNHWQNIDMGYGADTLAFEVDDMVIMDFLLLNFNSNGEIIQLMDFYTE